MAMRNEMRGGRAGKIPIASLMKVDGEAYHQEHRRMSCASATRVPSIAHNDIGICNSNEGANCEARGMAQRRVSTIHLSSSFRMSTLCRSEGTKLLLMS